MLQFLAGAVVGSVVTYFGSDVVADNCARAAYYSEQTLRNNQAIDQKAMEKIAKWSYDGTLQQHLNEIMPSFAQNGNFTPINQG